MQRSGANCFTKRHATRIVHGQTLQTLQYCRETQFTPPDTTQTAQFCRVWRDVWIGVFLQLHYAVTRSTTVCINNFTVMQKLHSAELCMRDTVRRELPFRHWVISCWLHALQTTAGSQAFNRPHRFRQARVYTVSQKNDINVALYNYNMHQPILVFFGTDVAAKVCHQM